MNTANRVPFWKTPLGWVCAGSAAAAAYFAATGHAGHVLNALAWLLLLACPLAHFFLHRGHHRHDDAGAPPREK